MAADAFGRKPVLVTIVSCLCLGCLAVAVLPWSVEHDRGDVWLLIASQAVVGLCGGAMAMNACCFAAAADVSAHMDITERARLFGLIESCLWVGLLLGPVLGGALAAHLGSDGTRLVFFFPAALGALCVLLLALVFRETLEPSRAVPGHADRCAAAALLGPHCLPGPWVCCASSRWGRPQARRRCRRTSCRWSSAWRAGPRRRPASSRPSPSAPVPSVWRPRCPPSRGCERTHGHPARQLLADPPLAGIRHGVDAVLLLPCRRALLSERDLVRAPHNMEYPPTR